jgi:hypothetical protein
MENKIKAGAGWRLLRRNSFGRTTEHRKEGDEWWGPSSQRWRSDIQDSDTERDKPSVYTYRRRIPTKAKGKKVRKVVIWVNAYEDSKSDSYWDTAFGFPTKAFADKDHKSNMGNRLGNKAHKVVISVEE